MTVTWLDLVVGCLIFLVALPVASHIERARQRRRARLRLQHRTREILDGSENARRPAAAGAVVVGLQITAFERVSVAPADLTREWHFFDNPEFPARSDTIARGHYETAGQSMSFKAGSYSC